LRVILAKRLTSASVDRDLRAREKTSEHAPPGSNLRRSQPMV
jgi:hypothetical protein